MKYAGILCLALFALLGVKLLSNQSPGLPAYVGTMGCSNSKQIFFAYENVTIEHRLWLGAAGGGSLDQWAINNNSYWSTFDAGLASHNTTNIWWPICIKTSATADEIQAWSQFMSALTNLRQRTQAPLWLTPEVGSQPVCTMDNDVLQMYVTNRAVIEGLAFRGTDIPPGSNPTADNCHFDPFASTNIGFAARDFIDGTATPSPTPTPSVTPTPTPTATPTPTPLPTVTLTATPTLITPSARTTLLSWNSTNASSCLASGGWTGSKALSGSESQSPKVTTTYTLTCSNASGAGGASVTVTVQR